LVIPCLRGRPARFQRKFSMDRDHADAFNEDYCVGRACACRVDHDRGIRSSRAERQMTFGLPNVSAAFSGHTLV
jgi:hypothetical protein